MLGFRKKAQYKKTRVKGRKYKQIAVTAEAHKAISKLAVKNKTTIIDQVNKLAGI